MNLTPDSAESGTANSTEYPARPEPAVAAAAFAAARDSLDLLFRPFSVGQWLKFSLICLVLGGGTPSAAFDWSLGSLPGDFGLEELAARVRQYVAQHLWLVAVVIVLVTVTGVLMLFLRASFRMVLVEAMIRRRVSLRPAWMGTRALRHSYFCWLLATLGSVGVFITVVSLLVFPYLRASAAAGLRSALFWILLGAILSLDVLIGLSLAAVVTLMDDLVVPIMYAERLTVLPAWKRLIGLASHEPWAFLTYLLWRFALSLALAVVVLFLVFSALLTTFSGAMITGALVVLTLHAWGMKWAWNVVTVILAAGGAGVLTIVVLLVLSLVSMPGQVFLQSFGMQFIAARLPSLEILLMRPAFLTFPPLAGTEEAV